MTGDVLEYYSDTMRHLICKPYSVENLHRMAEDLGIKRCWYDPNPYPHYDIPKKKVALIHSKTNVISAKELLLLIKENY